MNAINHGFEIATIHARMLEASITQSLRISETLFSDLRNKNIDQRLSDHIADDFKYALKYAPFLRSISALDNSGKIIASSNVHNLGIALQTNGFLPEFSSTGVLIGIPWIGRDFNEAHPIFDIQPASSVLPTFVPLLRKQNRSNDQYIMLTISPDYYMAQISDLLEANFGKVDVYRYDGILLFSSDSDKFPGSKDSDLNHRLNLDQQDAGKLLEMSTDNTSSSNVLAFQSSGLYPIVVLARLDLEHVLSGWYKEVKTLFFVLALVLILNSILVYVYYRRQILLFAAQLESERLQRINAAVFESSLEAILVTDICKYVISINQSFTRITGYTSEEIVGQSLKNHVPSDNHAQFDDFIRNLEITEAQKDGEFNPQIDRLLSTEAQFICKSGELIWVDVLATPGYDHLGTLTGYRCICRDITERRQMQEQVRHLAFYDPLTKLPNRRLLNDRLHQVLASNKRSGFYGAMIFLDLDNFKPINDQYGHTAGDMLLVEVAHRLKTCVREIDTVARFGGDEFVIALGSLSLDAGESRAQALAIAEKIRHALINPYLLAPLSGEEKRIVIEQRFTASMGITLFTGNSGSEDAVLRWADNAMYKAKESGRNAIYFHEE